jgi:hypothetical protein
VAGLNTSPGYLCLANVGGCDFTTIRLAKMYDHMLPAYSVRAVEHDRQTRLLWRIYMLQTYFTAKGQIDYFVVTDSTCNRCDGSSACCHPQQAGLSLQQIQLPSSPERALLKTLQADAMQARHDMDEAAFMVQDAGEGRADMEAWAVRMGLAGHLRGLRDDEIHLSYQLLPSRIRLAASSIKAQTEVDMEADEEADEEDDLRRIIAGVKVLLQDGYQLVSDRSLACRMI